MVSPNIVEQKRLRMVGIGVLGLIVAGYGISAIRSNSGGDFASGPAGAAVTGDQRRELVVQVAGAVKRPGLVKLSPGARMDDAIRAAGGLARTADESRLNLAESIEDGMKIMVPELGQADDSPVVIRSLRAPNALLSTKSSSRSASTTSRNKKGAPVGVISLNSATAEQLQTLPGIGPKTAQRILEYRQASGGFRSIEELEAVKGIGPKKLAAMRPHLKL